MNFREFQEKHNAWAVANFGGEKGVAKSLEKLAGVTEEVGELAHALLKAKQGIRGTHDEHMAAAADAIGDICAYLADVCYTLDLDLQTAVKSASDVFLKRDWKRFPRNGVDE